MSEATNAAKVQSPKTSFAKVFAASTAILLFIGSIYVFGVARDTARSADCQAAMKQIGLDFKRYASDSKEEKWPALASKDGLWVPELEPLYAKYRHVTSPANMVSIFHPEQEMRKREIAEAWNQPLPDFDKAARIFGESFGYFGYTIQDEADFEALRLARSQHAILPDGKLPSASNPSIVFPLREGVERFLITDINGPGLNLLLKYQSIIPVLIEIASWKHKDSGEDFEGTNVLYFDGHVEFVSLGNFPVLPSILDALSGI